MMNFSSCIEMMFCEVEFMDRFEAAAKAGLKAVEYWGWMERDKSEIQDKLQQYGLKVSSVSCGGSGKDYQLLNEKGISFGGDTRAQFVGVLEKTIEYARAMDIHRLLVGVGNDHADISREKQHANIVETLMACAPVLKGNDIKLVIEPLNVLVDHMGYFLVTSEEGAQIVDEVNNPQVKMLFDIYHQQISEGNLINNITRYIDRIAHFHVADNPGRHEPGTGEIYYPRIFEAIEKLGYEGYIGLEYMPTKNSADTLWFIK